ncbi:MAG: hypothetical protein LWX54_12580 [Deltaproteobacteria bacterium]|jgi:hypothetical protein|nr:hypothetical protein [Deltaproteobacteria bacterium]
MKLHNIVDGKHQCDTYTVEDLINELQQYPSTMPVVGEWDTFGSPICNIRVTQGNDLFKDAVIVLDVSNMWFKSKC